MNKQKTTDFLIREYSDQELYDIATDILYHLGNKHYCIWQTYTKDDIEQCTCEKATNERMDTYQEAIRNFFGDYYCD